MNVVATEPAPAPSSRISMLLALKWLVLLLVVATSLWAGYVARVWQFNITQPVHFLSDVTRNWLWGSYTFASIHDKGRSFLDTYDDVGIQDRSKETYIDYAPLRLAVFSMWAASDEKAYPNRKYQFPAGRSPDTRDFHAFYLDFNMAMEIIGAAGAFFLVRAVVRRANAREDLFEPWWTFTGVTAALTAALILWFNPAMWLSAHSWPGGDSWIIPPFLWASYFAVRRHWCTAGVVLAIGGLFKGQQFIIAPVFILWPLFQGRPRSALRLAGGILALFGLATVGWTLTYIDPQGIRRVSWLAVSYVASLAAVAGLLPIVCRLIFRSLDRAKLQTEDEVDPLASAGQSFDTSDNIVASPPPPLPPLSERRYPRLMVRLGGVIFCFAALLWPLFVTVPITNGTQLQFSRDTVGILTAVVALSTALAGVMIPPRRFALAVLAAAGAGALASMLLFNTCFAWFDAGYQFGTDHWEYWVMGLTSNLPGLMQLNFGWDGHSINEVVFNLTDKAPVTMRQLLLGIFLILMTLSAAGIAMHDRRRSRRLLIAICTPWLLFFCIPAQIHERYLLFGAAVAAVCVGESVGMALLGIFLSAVTWIMTMHVLLNGWPRRSAWDKFLSTNYPQWFAPKTAFAQSLQRFLDGTHPGIAWAVLLATAVFFYLTVTPLWVRRRRARVAIQPTEAMDRESPPVAIL